MGAALRTAQLASERVVQAYPLIREVAPNLSLAEWVDFARPLSAQKGDTGGCRGIIIAERSRYIRGLFIYEVNPELSHGRTLFTRNIIVLDLVQRDAVAEALVDAMERLAQAHGGGTRRHTYWRYACWAHTWPCGPRTGPGHHGICIVAL